MTFTPLEFRPTTHGALKPPIFDGDHTHGEDYGVGELVSLACSIRDKALLLGVRFTAGPDAAAAGWAPDEVGEMEFIVVEKQGRYVGGIHRQSPEGFAWMTGEKMQILDVFGAGPAPGHAGRNAAHYFPYRSGLKQRACLPVTVYFRKGWLGGWKEIVVQVPKKTLYVARP